MPLSGTPGATPENRYHIGDSVTLVLRKGGVITGTVTTQTGEPMVGIRVRARMISEPDRQAVPVSWFLLERPTDDRGIYRIYGVPEGKYLVWAGGGGMHPGMDPYDVDVPTFAPASTRDTAEEIVVRAGEEISNVDIRYRGEPGRIISGKVKRTDNEGAGFSISLTSPGDKGAQWTMMAPQHPTSPGFSFYGVDDGDYDVTARTPLPTGEWLISPSKRIKVRGADVTGIELIVQPLGSINGRVVLEETKAVECTDKQQPTMTQITVSAWHNETEETKDLPSFIWGIGAPVSADEQGNVTLRNLAPGDYYFRTQFPANQWYLKSVTFGKTPLIDATRNWTTIKYGDRLSGLTITLARGAASLRGQLALAEDEKPPASLFAYLVPAEKERADEALRFSSVPVFADGKITVNNIPPGRYLIMVQPGPQLMKLRLPGETQLRAKLRREAEAAKTEIEFKPCQNVVDFKLPWKH